MFSLVTKLLLLYLCVTGDNPKRDSECDVNIQCRSTVPTFFSSLPSFDVNDPPLPSVKSIDDSEASRNW